MKCYNCKATIPDDASVCPTCGRQQGFDAKTIRAASKGDEAALTELYEKTYASVYNTIRFMVRDDDVALDILQDSYVKAFRSLDTLQDPSRFGAWMRRIVHNRAVDYLRQEKPVSLGSLTADESEDEVELVDDRPDSLPDVVLDQQETARLLGAILDELPDDQRVCVTMYYYEQLSVREIAQELEMPEATVKSRLMYGRKKIEQQVKALERRGTKLYSVAPVALLMWLFRNQQAQAAV
ncbi:MAG: RNA polymerase sigma factor, partial [Atopobiaceae bacterium]|nr:RNA polymerase sigma factor [Atopobiaceae bacterium]